MTKDRYASPHGPQPAAGALPAGELLSATGRTDTAEGGTGTAEGERHWFIPGLAAAPSQPSPVGCFGLRPSVVDRGRSVGTRTEIRASATWVHGSASGWWHTVAAAEVACRWDRPAATTQDVGLAIRLFGKTEQAAERQRW